MSATEQATNQAEALLGYYDNDGCKLVRLDRETKNPVNDKWQSRDVPLHEIIDWYNRGGNVGMQMGGVSAWRGAVDCDCPEAVKLAPKFLPETLRLGKGSGAPDVYLYRSPRLGYRKFAGLDKKTIIDIKASSDGKGHQIAVPPSIHPDKGSYQWVHGYNPASIAEAPADELNTQVGQLATAALIAQNIPPKGGIHDFELALAGYLLRSGRLDQETALKIMLSAWRAAGVKHSRAERGVEGAVSYANEELAAGRKHPGGKMLEESVSGLPKKIAEFLDFPPEENLYDIHVGSSEKKSYTHSDLGNAERFVSQHGDNVRWCPARKSWFLYDGMRWARDERGHVVKLAHQTARSIFKDAARETDEAKQKEIAKFAVASQNKTRIDGLLSQAKPYLAVGMDELDQGPWLLNCENGTLDLRTGELRPHEPEDLITRLAPAAYDPRATCPRFKQFLKEILVDDDVTSFVKRFAGYTLTGITRERLFAILHGGGKNGKSTLIEVLHDVMGDYATNTDTETILAKRHQGVGNDVAALKGARFVSAAEVEQGRRLAESKVKQLTGNDTVTARFLFGEPFDFRPAFKLWLSTNNKPVIQGTDDAIWDRIRLVPFGQRFVDSQADANLPEKLREELPGVLAWMVEGCLEWQEHGLGEPESVKAATDQYRSEMDTLAAFIEDRCIVRRDATAQATPLYQQYRIWCDSAGERADKQKTFGMRLTERGFESGRASSGVNKGRAIWSGIGLRHDTDPPDEADDPSPSEPSPDDPSPDESGVGMGDTAGSTPSSEGSEGTNHKVPLENPRVYKEYGKPFTSFTSFTDEKKATDGGPESPPPNRPTPDQNQAIVKLMAQGMAREMAYAEVLGEEG